MAALQELALMILGFICSACTLSSSFPARSHSERMAPSASGGVRQKWAIPAPYTPRARWITSCTTNRHSRRSPEEQRAEPHKAQVSSPWHRGLTQHRQGQAAAAPPSPAGVRAGRARLFCHQPPCTETAQTEELSEQLELTLVRASHL